MWKFQKFSTTQDFTWNSFKISLDLESQKEQSLSSCEFPIFLFLGKFQPWTIVGKSEFRASEIIFDFLRTVFVKVILAMKIFIFLRCGWKENASFETQILGPQCGNFTFVSHSLRQWFFLLRFWNNLALKKLQYFSKSKLIASETYKLDVT